MAKYARVRIEGLREFEPEKGPIGARFLNASNTHLQEVE
jgi:hypothetical protein